MAEILATNLLSPVVLAFALGALATLVKSDLEFPEPLYQALSIYLLLAIGLKGGAALAVTPMSVVWAPAAMTLFLGALTPVTAFVILRYVGKMDRINAGALAAHYGSVSAVTFLAAIAFAEATGAPAEGFMPALVALLEVPAIGVGLLLARMGARSSTDAPTKDPQGTPTWVLAAHEVLTGRSIVLLVGGLLIGWISGPARMAEVEPFFTAIFPGVLSLFLLEMGLVAARRLRDLRETGVFLVLFGTLVPVLHGALGVWGGTVAGLSVSGAAVFGTLVASASYIAAPAAVRVALPEAKPSLYLTASLGITFPFNLVFGIPIFFAMARFIGG
ncbi:MAG: sodium-dependent bicarbonate transport family permease [Gemmatimonadales bacterium]|nr:MAG: sodium-dependent bicarbonate transport family permease [Gemmatimonadales bacterium]